MRKRVRIISLGVVLFLILLATGCDKAGDAKVEKIPDGAAIESEDVVLSLLAQGINLTPSPKDPWLEELSIEGQAPEPYELDSAMKLYIYEFKDFAAREEAMQSWNPYELNLHDDKAWQPGPPLLARNVMLQPLFAIQEGPPDPDALDARNEKWKRIEDVIFDRINQGKTLIYRGKGALWEGEMIQMSYLHWYEVQNAHNDLVASVPDGYTKTCRKFVYIGAHPEELVDLRVTFGVGDSTQFTHGLSATDGVIQGCSTTATASNHDRPHETMWFRAAWGEKSDEFELVLVMTDG